MTTGFFVDENEEFPVILKDPDAELDYSVDWNEDGWLGADVILTSVWLVPSELTLQAESNTDTVATAILTGGIAGRDHVVTNRVTKTGGLGDDRSFIVRMKER